jgi:glycosyltransferase involved in cell wall biosynthesis
MQHILQERDTHTSRERASDGLGETTVGGRLMSEREALVSIVVPCFARTARDERLLDETLGTVDAQTRSEYEVIVVDDGSPRDIEETVRSHPQTRLIRQENAGSAAARNAGIAASWGSHFIFLDADDHLLPPAIEVGLAELDAHPECGFVVGPHEEMTYEGEPVAWQVPLPPPGTDIYHALLRFEWYIIAPSSAMFRREAVLTVTGFQDPWGADDLDFYLRVARRYDAWCFQSPAVTRYRRYSASSSRDGELMLRSIRAVYERQWPVVEHSAEGREAFRTGLSRLTDIFTDCLVENTTDRVRARNWRGAARAAAILGREKPAKLLRLAKALGAG